MDAPSVGLETSEAGEHQDSEEECQHGDTQRGVCDQSQCLQIALQLLLIDREKENERGGYWVYIILVRADEKKVKDGKAIESKEVERLTKRFLKNHKVT